MAELADAADSKSAEVHPSWGFNSPSRHQLTSVFWEVWNESSFGSISPEKADRSRTVVVAVMQGR